MGYGNATGYYDVNKLNTQTGVSCSDDHSGLSWNDTSLDQPDPADACYTGMYSTDAFVGRARQVIDPCVTSKVQGSMECSKIISIWRFPSLFEYDTGRLGHPILPRDETRKGGGLVRAFSRRR